MKPVISYYGGKKLSPVEPRQAVLKLFASGKYDCFTASTPEGDDLS